MEKNKNKINMLIKKNQLLKLIKEKEINRASKEAVKEIQEKLKIYLLQLIEQARDNMLAHGRNTLLKEDIEKSAEDSGQD